MGTDETLAQRLEREQTEAASELSAEERARRESLTAEFLGGQESMPHFDPVFDAAVGSGFDPAAYERNRELNRPRR